jgi:hypothetical protein
VESKLHKLPSDAKKARLGVGPSEEERGSEPLPKQGQVNGFSQGCDSS